MSSIDKKVGQNKEQQHSEGQGEKGKQGHSSSGSGSSTPIDRINAELAKPNLSEPARKALEDKKRQLTG